MGNIVKINKNDSIPSDILIIKSSNTNNLGYLETTNLDGESALKPREAVGYFANQIKHAPMPMSLYTSMANNNSQSSFDIIDLPFLSNKIIIKVDIPNKNIYQIDGYIEDIKGQIYFNINNILLRGGRLKNVDFIYGIILYSGKDTKLMQNINNSSYKKSSIERSVNIIVVLVIVITFIICIAGGLIGHFKEMALKANGHFYLFTSSLIKKENYVVIGFKYLGTFFAIFNNIIPICLMIALEAVKGLQVIFTSFDTKLYDGPNDQLKILSFRLHEDLGNIQYLFSDKTGTLTKNEMKFKACSVYNRLYSSKKTKRDRDKENLLSFFDENFDKEALIVSFNDNAQLNIQSSEVPIETISDSMKYFFLNIVLNHGVLTEKPLKENNQERVFQGTNPDELTLVQAANEINIKYIERIGNIIRLSIFNTPIEYEVIHRFEFSSERLRSSILVREHNNKSSPYYLFMKGADSVILTRKCLDAFSLTLLYKTAKEHIHNFAKEGYRTLCYCMRIVDDDVFNSFNDQYIALKEQSIKNKALLINLENLISSIETSMTLLGVTSLEDKLQENVKSDIQELIEAGIHVWMLTGDKMDTAETIAYSCKLFNNDTEVFKIKAHGEIAIPKLLMSISDQMQKTEDKMNKINKEKFNQKYSKITKELKFVPKKIKQEDFIKYLAEKFEDMNGANGAKDDNKEKERKEESKKEQINHTNMNMNINNVYSVNLENKDKEIQRIVHSKIRPTSSNIKKIFTKKNKESNEKVNDNEIMTINKNSKENNNMGINDRDIIQFICGNKKDHDEHMHKSNNSSDDDSVNSVIKEIIYTIQTQNDNNQGNDDNFQHMNINNDNKEKQIITNSVFKPSTTSIGISSPIPSSNKLLSNFKDTTVDQYRMTICNKLSNIEEIQRQSNFRMRKSNKMNNILSNRDALKNFGLIIEGISITKCMDPLVEELFMRIITKCRSVICSRCAPIQKSDMVAFVKRKSALGEGVTLAIGDGGNDVSMIKEADIGIGIFGKEGYQAAFNSDYAISQFKYLKRLIFYHGRYFLMRNSYFIYYFFYKSVIYTMIHFWYLFYNCFSSSFIYDDSMFLIYNAVGSNIPVAIRAVLEQDIDIDFEGYPKKNDIKKLIPDIYREYRERQPFSYFRFWIIFGLSLIHSIIIYYVPANALYLTTITPDGFPADYWTYALQAYLNVIIIQTLVILADSYLFKPFTFFAYFLHVFFNLITIIANNFNADDQCGGITFELAGTWHFWLVLVLTFSIAYYPYLFYTRFDLFFIYDIINDLRFGKYEYDIDKKVCMRKLEQINKLKRLIIKFKKFYNEKDFQPDNIRDNQMKEIVEKYKRLKEQLRQGDSNSQLSNNNREGNNNVDYSPIKISSNERLNNYFDTNMNINNNDALVYDYPEFLLKENQYNKDNEEENDDYAEYEYMNDRSE